MSPTRKVTPPGSARLFADSHPSAPPAGVYVANIDGASRGNPGPASYAVVLRDPEGKIVLELAKNIGRETNNVAEYFALLAALDYATSAQYRRAARAQRFRVAGAPDAGPLQSEKPGPEAAARTRLEARRQLQYFAIEHVRRELNRDADALANVALDSAGVPEIRRPQIPDRSAATTRNSRAAATRSTHAGAFHASASRTLIPRAPSARDSSKARSYQPIQWTCQKASEVTLDVRIPLKQ